MEGLTSRDLVLLVAGVVITLVIERVLIDRVMGGLWVRTRAFTRRGRLKDRERYRAMLERMHRSDRDDYSQLLIFVFAVLILLSVGILIIPALARFQFGPETLLGLFRIDVTFFQGVIGGVAVLLAFGGVLFQRDVQQYDTAIARLDQQIADLKKATGSGEASG
jgi:hypothetical protein